MKTKQIATGLGHNLIASIMLTGAIWLAGMNWKIHQSWQSLNELSAQSGFQPIDDTARFTLNWVVVGCFIILALLFFARARMYWLAMANAHHKIQ